jgi:hypothetical protein
LPTERGFHGIQTRRTFAPNWVELLLRFETFFSDSDSKLNCDFIHWWIPGKISPFRSIRKAILLLAPEPILNLARTLDCGDRCLAAACSSYTEWNHFMESQQTSLSFSLLGSSVEGSSAEPR